MDVNINVSVIKRTRGLQENFKLNFLNYLLEN